MTSVYSIKSSTSGVDVENCNVDSQALPAGYSGMVTVQTNGKFFLYAFDNTKKANATDVYELTGSSPFIKKLNTGIKDLDGNAWDILKSFVLGNKPYVLAYESKSGILGFYEVYDDATLSIPYKFVNRRDWPTQNFTEVSPFVSLGLLYVLCYDGVKGTVAVYSLSVISSSAGGIPPLNMLNVWYHHWAKGWHVFSFFQLGQSNFFFKINTAKLNVNIDHLQDNPAMGSVEIGSWLQDLLPNALQVTLTSIIPWENGEPYLSTYDGTTNDLNIYRIHADCQGWTDLNTTTVDPATQLYAYRIGDTSYLLFYS